MSFNDPAGNGFDMSDAYRAASRVKPVKARDLKTAYRPYKNTGKLKLNVGFARSTPGGKTDAQLYRRAAAEVVEWFRAQRAQMKGKGKAKASGPTRRPAGRPRTQSRPAGSAGGSARTGARLPDTSMQPTRARVTTATRLPSITPSEGTTVNRSAPSTTSSGVRIQRPAGRGFTQYGI